MPSSTSDISPPTPLPTPFNATVLFPFPIIDINPPLLWGLLFSLTCAMVALSLRQWEKPLPVRGFLSTSLPERARFCVVCNAERGSFHIIIHMLHAMVQVSFIVFFFGLLVYLYNINSESDAFFATFVFVMYSSSAYLYWTVIPIIRPTAPYFTP